MKDIRVDSDGEFRCWNCGSKGLLAKRTFRSKMAFGVGALLTKKKLKCQTCGEYNDTGGAKPFTGPESRKWRKTWEKQEAAKSAQQRAWEMQQATAHSAELAQEMATQLPPPPPTAAVAVAAAGWYADPSGSGRQRYHDGMAWTDHYA